MCGEIFFHERHILAEFLMKFCWEGERKQAFIASHARAVVVFMADEIFFCNVSNLLSLANSSHILTVSSTNSWTNLRVHLGT